jgi:hypothetical protein
MLQQTFLAQFYSFQTTILLCTLLRRDTGIFPSNCLRFCLISGVMGRESSPEGSPYDGDSPLRYPFAIPQGGLFYPKLISVPVQRATLAAFNLNIGWIVGDGGTSIYFISAQTSSPSSWHISGIALDEFEVGSFDTPNTAFEGSPSEVINFVPNFHNLITLHKDGSLIETAGRNPAVLQAEPDLPSSTRRPPGNIIELWGPDARVVDLCQAPLGFAQRRLFTLVKNPLNSSIDSTLWLWRGEEPGEPHQVASNVSRLYPGTWDCIILDGTRGLFLRKEKHFPNADAAFPNEQRSNHWSGLLAMEQTLLSLQLISFLVLLLATLESCRTVEIGSGGTKLLRRGSVSRTAAFFGLAITTRTNLDFRRRQRSFTSTAWSPIGCGSPIRDPFSVCLN